MPDTPPEAESRGLTLEAGTAGASARRGYRRRFGRERARTQAWIGAGGGERVAQVLAGTSVIALHDRRVPESRARIDHLDLIAVGPAGVFVIDAKDQSGQIEARHNCGGLRSDVRLYVEGRDRTELTRSVRTQCRVVHNALGADLSAVPVCGVLCFVGADGTSLIFDDDVTVAGVTCIRPSGLPDIVEAPRRLSRSAVAIVAMRLLQALPPA